jgi:hypothetical protein
MDKKDLKWYEAPQMEVVEMKHEGFLCASGGDPEDDDEF